MPRLGGHRAEFAFEHHQAAALQARHPRIIVWFGEATQSFWIATPAGLEEAADVDTLLLKLWSHTDSFEVSPRAQSPGSRIPAPT